MSHSQTNHSEQGLQACETLVPRGQGRLKDQNCYIHVRQQVRASQQVQALHGILSCLLHQGGQGDLGHQRGPKERQMKTIASGNKTGESYRCNNVACEKETYRFAFDTGITFVSGSTGFPLKVRREIKESLLWFSESNTVMDFFSLSY